MKNKIFCLYLWFMFFSNFQKKQPQIFGNKNFKKPERDSIQFFSECMIKLRVNIKKCKRNVQQELILWNWGPKF